MAIQTVIRKVGLASQEPFCMWSIPLQNSVPFLEPVQLPSHTSPKLLGISRGFRPQLLQLGHRFDVGVGGKFGRWRKNTFFSQDRVDIAGNCRHNPRVSSAALFSLNALFVLAVCVPHKARARQIILQNISCAFVSFVGMILWSICY